MSKQDNATLAVIVFAVTELFFCLLAFSQQFSLPAVGLIGIVLVGLDVGLLLSWASYAIVGAELKHRDSEQEKAAQAIFAPTLPAGDVLLAWVKGQTVPGRVRWTLLGPRADVPWHRSKHFYVGVTRQNLLLVVPVFPPHGPRFVRDPANRQKRVLIQTAPGERRMGVHYVLSLSEVKQLKLETGILATPFFTLEFDARRIEMYVDYNSIARARSMEQAWHKLALAHPRRRLSRQLL